MPSAEAARVDEIIHAYKARVLAGPQDLTMDQRRAVTDGIGQWASVRDDVSVEEVTLGGQPARLFTPHGAEAGRAILYLHGGGYVMGSLESHGRMMAHLAHHTATTVYGLDFRRAPEHPYPAALDDATAAYEELIRIGWDPHQIVLAGDSAGGGLALAVIDRVRREGSPVPAGAILLSPWLDLALTGPSIKALADVDTWTTEPTLTAFARFYAGDESLDDPRISPLYMDFAGMPPMLIHVSATEILFDDAARAADRATAAGVDVTLASWDAVPHVFQLFAGQLPEATESFDAIAAWLEERTSPGARP